MSFFAALAPAVGNLVGGYFASKENRKAQEANANLQREFAREGLRWKVEDAKAAGIHPLAALGASTHSASPSFVGDTSMANALSNTGQDIGRAISATRTQSERDLAALQIQGTKLDIEGKALDNQIKNSQLKKLEATGPAFPGTNSFIPGQGDSGTLIKENQMERSKTLPGSPQSEPGALPDMGWAKTKTGVVPVPSKDVKERIEDSMPHEWSHFIRNNVAPNWGGGTKPPKSALPKGYSDWEWSFTSQEFQPVKSKSRTPWEKASRWYDKNLRWPK